MTVLMKMVVTWLLTIRADLSRGALTKVAQELASLSEDLKLVAAQAVMEALEVLVESVTPQLLVALELEELALTVVSLEADLAPLVWLDL